MAGGQEGLAWVCLVSVTHSLSPYVLLCTGLEHEVQPPPWSPAPTPVPSPQSPILRVVLAMSASCSLFTL